MPLHFAQPTFADLERRADEPKDFTPETPGASLRMALEYYRIEGYARKSDRDAACGPTAHADVDYAPIAPADARRIGGIACGYPFDHPRFETVFAPIFARSVERLIGNMVRANRNAEGPIAAETLCIARTHYNIEAIAKGSWIMFDVEGLTLFEKRDSKLVSNTCAFLEGRLQLHFHRAGPTGKAN